jgi:hypothetical protein
VKTNEVKLLPIDQLERNVSEENSSSSTMDISAEYKLNFNMNFFQCTGV